MSAKPGQSQELEHKQVEKEAGVVNDEMMETLNPEIRKLLIETNTNISDPRDVEALSNVSVRELTNLFDNISKGMTKEQAFIELRDAAVKKMEEKKRVKESILKLKEDHETLLVEIQDYDSRKMAQIVRDKQMEIEEAKDMLSSDEVKLMTRNLTAIHERLAATLMEEEEERRKREEEEERKRKIEAAEKKQCEEEEQQRRQVEEEKRKKREEEEAQLKRQLEERQQQELDKIVEDTMDETVSQVQVSITELEAEIEQREEESEENAEEGELEHKRAILEKLNRIHALKKEEETKKLGARLEELQTEMERLSVVELQKLEKQKSQYLTQLRESDNVDAELSATDNELKAITERLKAYEASIHEELSPSVGSNMANEESLTSEADQTGTGGGDDEENDSEDDDDADVISLPEDFDMKEFLNELDSQVPGEGEEQEIVVVHEYDIERLDKKTWLHHRFDVTKYDPKNRFLRKKSRTWEIDFFGNKLNNMSRKGKIKKSLDPENLFRLERIPSDNKRILMGFFGSRHAYELVFSSNELRERFYESVAAMRLTEFSWCPDICKPGMEKSKTVLQGQFNVTYRGAKKKIDGEARINVTSNPKEEVNVFCGTWNMGKSSPPKDPQLLKSFIPPNAFDMYAIGIVDTGFNKMSEFKSYILELLGKEYFCVVSTSQSSIQLVIFARKKNFLKFSNVESQSKATGIMGFGNKGGVAIGMRYNETSILFINTYLASNKSIKADTETAINAEGSKLRSQNVQEILDSCRFKNRELDLYSQFHHIFFMGDLNYRIGLGLDDTMRLIKNNDFSELVKYDQLREEMYLGRLLAEFKESEITFPPTYKYQVGTTEYDVKNDRIPSYTDRVLYKSLPGCDVSCENYGSCSDITTTGHFPVYAHFKVSTIRPYASIFSRSVPNRLLIVEEVFVSGRLAPMARPMMTFYSEFIPSNESTPKLGMRSANPMWTARQLPTLRLSTSNTDFLREQHLLISLRDGAAKGENIDNLIGTTAVPLSSVVDKMPEPAEIELPMYRHGVVSCTMVIKMHLMS